MHCHAEVYPKALDHLQTAPTRLAKNLALVSKKSLMETAKRCVTAMAFSLRISMLLSPPLSFTVNTVVSWSQ